MKRYLLIILLLGTVLALLSASNQVTIKLTTSVPEILIHGFLRGDSTTEIFASEDVDDGFNPDGASFTYAVKTNTSIPMTVYASITPFQQQQALDPAFVNIEKILVGKDNQNESDSIVLSGYESPYDLITLNPDQGGMAVYAYTLTVVASQSDVETAPAGEYKSTVSIGIRTEN